MGNWLLRAYDLACVRGGRRLFTGVGMTVAAGEAIVVTGANGSGKSSLLRCLAGLLRPAAGSVERCDRFAYLGHDNALKPGRTLGDELAWWAALDGSEPAFSLGLAGLASVPVRMLSAGQKRRAALARVFASRVPLWLLDEPASGLDAASAAALSAALADHRAAGGGIVMASHGETQLAGARELAL